MESYETLFPQESVTELLDDIEHSKFREVYFSNDMKKIYGLKGGSLSDSIYYDDFVITYANPIITQSVLDTTRKNHIKTFVLPETPTLINLSGFFFINLFRPFAGEISATTIYIFLFFFEILANVSAKLLRITVYFFYG